MAENIVELLTDVADAIREKKGTTEPINAQNFAEEIRSIEGGGEQPSVEEKDVNFYDYDGTLLFSYTIADVQALTELPTPKGHKGLIFQGWNYTLEDAKEYAAEYGMLRVGATYITDDGKTRLYITIAAEGRMDVPLRLQQSVSEGVVVDWGDGSTETFSGTSATILRHTYGKVGAYVITLEVLSGTLTLSGSTPYGIFADSKRVYSNMLQKVEIGNGVTSIGSYAFNYCYSLASIVIPNGVTSIENYAFYYCHSLASIVIPNGVTSIGSYVFQYCYSLVSAIIPNGLTAIGSYAFYYCYSLASITIPNGVTSIGSYVFQYCYSLASITIPNGVTTIGSNAFSSCFSLASITIPNGVTAIKSYVFYNCYSLASIVIPNRVTTIESCAFYNCYSLASIVIPNGVTTIGSQAFNNCSSVAFYDFRTHTSVPTLSATSAFNNIPSDCKIVVPDALYDNWITATNWTTYASYIVKASEYV